MANDMWEVRKRGPVQAQVPTDAKLTAFERQVLDENNTGHGFTKKALKANGISWPPPKGWRTRLKAQILSRVEREAKAPLIEPVTAAPPPEPPEESPAPTFEEDSKKLDVVGFALASSLKVWPGPKNTVRIEQSGSYAVSMGRHGKQPVRSYVVVPKSKIPELIKELRALA